ncbi:hypothetical protein HDU96_006819 [Phlyctochytrium bullatum]|nr:hypothetical protein HDU96_006819 [Phlyctochytrium bullatum]
MDTASRTSLLGQQLQRQKQLQLQQQQHRFMKTSTPSISIIHNSSFSDNRNNTSLSPLGQFPQQLPHQQQQQQFEEFTPALSTLSSFSPQSSLLEEPSALILDCLPSVVPSALVAPANPLFLLQGQQNCAAAAALPLDSKNLPTVSSKSSSSFLPSPAASLTLSSPLAAFTPPVTVTANVNAIDTLAPPYFKDDQQRALEMLAQSLGWDSSFSNTNFAASQQPVLFVPPVEPTPLPTTELALQPQDALSFMTPEALAQIDAYLRNLEALGTAPAAAPPVVIPPTTAPAAPAPTPILINPSKVAKARLPAPDTIPPLAIEPTLAARSPPPQPPVLFAPPKRLLDDLDLADISSDSDDEYDDPFRVSAEDLRRVRQRLGSVDKPEVYRFSPSPSYSAASEMEVESGAAPGAFAEAVGPFEPPAAASGRPVRSAAAAAARRAREDAADAAALGSSSDADPLYEDTDDDWTEPTGSSSAAPAPRSGGPTTARRCTGYDHRPRSPKPYVCRCGRSYESKGSWRAHAKQDGAAPEHVCGVEGCGRAFVRKQDLDRHRGTHGGGMGFECGVCGKRLSRADARNRHLVRQHGVVVGGGGRGRGARGGRGRKE